MPKSNIDDHGPLRSFLRLSHGAIEAGRNLILTVKCPKYL
jgi:hypothetical protein